MTTQQASGGVRVQCEWWDMLALACENTHVQVEFVYDQVVSQQLLL